MEKKEETGHKTDEVKVNGDQEGEEELMADKEEE